MTATNHMIFLAACIRISLVTVAISRFASYIPVPQWICRDEKEKLSFQRSIAVTLLWIILMMASSWYFGEGFVQDNLDFYALNWKAIESTGFALLVTAMLFFGNIMYQMFHASEYEGLVQKVKENWKTHPISTFKVYVVAPAYEEATFTVFLYAVFKNLGLESNIYYCLATSICFGLSHIHMKWESVKEILKNPAFSWKSKIQRTFNEVAQLVIITTVFCLYSKVMFIKRMSFWPCFAMHALCNLLGAPRTGFPSALQYHAIGVIGFIFILMTSETVTKS